MTVGLGVARMNEAARAYARAQLRSSRRQRLALVLALGVIGAIAMGAAAGAVRTGSAVDRFLVEQRAFDVLVFCGPPDQGPDFLECEQRLRGVEGIADTAALVTLEGFLSVGGRTVDPTEDRATAGLEWCSSS